MNKINPNSRMISNRVFRVVVDYYHSNHSGLMVHSLVGSKQLEPSSSTESDAPFTVS